MATPHELGGVAPGTLLGKYQVLKHLATGGMAEIFLARTIGVEGFERYVVVKCIKHAYANDPQFVQMFLDEARISAQLHHQHIAQVFDMGVEHDVLYFAMEHVHGQNVQSILLAAQTHGHHVPYEHAISIVLGAAAGLDYAHDRIGPDGVPLDIVHRDVTPTNILVSYDGAVKVVDFGIVKASSRATHTRSGVLKGKLQYMSPEQCKSGDIDRRSDVFALGILLYELTTLRHLYQGASDYETMDQIVRAAVTPPSTKRASYPPELEAIVLTCLAKNPADRYQTAGALVEDLISFAQRAMMTPTAVGLARYMRELFGKPGEPWLGLPPTPPHLSAPARAYTPLDARPAHGDAAMRPLVGVAIEALQREAPTASSGELLVPAPPVASAPAPRRRGLISMLAAGGVLAIAAVVMIVVSRSGGSVRAAPAASASASTETAATTASTPSVAMPVVASPTGETDAPKTDAPNTASSVDPMPTSSEPASANGVTPAAAAAEAVRTPKKKSRTTKSASAGNAKLDALTPTPPASAPIKAEPTPDPEPTKLRDGAKLRPPD